MAGVRALPSAGLAIISNPIGYCAPEKLSFLVIVTPSGAVPWKVKVPSASPLSFKVAAIDSINDRRVIGRRRAVPLHS